MRRIPYTVVSGFLGAGKTTLVNRVLHHNRGVRFAVIVNEFGEIGLDSALIRGEGRFVKMDNGCLCCVLNEDLARTLMELKDRDDYDAVVLETTGVADPLPVAWTFLREAMAGRFRFAGIVTVADALNLDSMLAKAGETRLQIERADYLYLAKTAAAGPEKKESAEQAIAAIAPNARIVRDDDPLWLELLFDLSEKEGLPVPRDDGGRVHDHGASYASLSLPLKGRRLDPAAAEDFFEALPHGVFRAKAVFDGTDGATYVLHAVCGRVEMLASTPREPVRAAVFIGRDFDAAAVRKGLEGVCHSP